MTQRAGPASHIAGLSHAAWRTSSYTADSGQCVAIAFLSGGRVAVRHSKRPDDGVLVYTPGEWDAFIEGAKDGEFDPR